MISVLSKRQRLKAIPGTSPKAKVETYIRAKHWKALVKDPAKDRPGKKLSGDFHPFRVDLPFREQDIRLWKANLAKQRQEEYENAKRQSKSGGCSPKEVVGTNYQRKLSRACTPFASGRGSEGACIEYAKEPRGSAEKQIAAVRKRYLLGQSKANIPILGDNLSLIKHYSMNEGKDLAADVKDRAKRMREARPKKYCIDADVTLLVQEEQDRREPGVSPNAHSETASFISPDCAPVPFTLTDRLIDHIRAIPALPFTRFVQASSIQSFEAMMEEKRDLNSSFTVDSPEPGEDSDNGSPDDGASAETKESLTPELMETIRKYRSGDIWVKLKDIISPFQKQIMEYKSELLNQHMDTKTIFNP